MQLQTLNMSDNFLVGTLPETWSTFTNVSLSHSKVTDTSPYYYVDQSCLQLRSEAEKGTFQHVILALLDSGNRMLIKP